MKYLLGACSLFLAVVLFAVHVAAQSPKPEKPTRTGGAKIDASYKEVAWDELVPRDWDPARSFKSLELDTLRDNDPRAAKELELMKKAWDNAPIVPELDGRKVKIAGFVVPIESTRRAVTEFLLVPYFGACIHVPPPPANQIIHVVSAKPVENLHNMVAVWVAGKLKAARFSTQTDMGVGASGYRIDSVSVTPYDEPAIMSITPSR